MSNSQRIMIWKIVPGSQPTVFSFFIKRRIIPYSNKPSLTNELREYLPFSVSPREYANHFYIIFCFWFDSIFRITQVAQKTVNMVFNISFPGLSQVEAQNS